MEDQTKERYTPTSSNFNLDEDKYLFQSQQSGAFNDLNYRLLHPDILKNPRPSALRNASAKTVNDPVESEKGCDECKESLEPYCHVKLNSIIKLKDSTKKLLHLLDEIQSKTHSKSEFLTLETFIKPIPPTSPVGSDRVSVAALSKLEYQANNLDAIYVQEEDDDCSVYKRLTRKCNCLNNVEYNDFIIHFNEETKYSTSNIGEIIKNMRILKKFLYMGGVYTKKALMFLNEGLSDCPHTEKVEITQGATHADICNIFEDHSIVVTCISWPCKNDYFGDPTSQALASGLLNKLAEIEEGRRYLNFTTRLTNDIRKVLRKKSSYLDMVTIESLNATLDLLKPPFTKNLSPMYFCKSIYEGFGYKTVNDLLKFRKYMTLDEILTHLDLLKSFSSNENGKLELTSHLLTVIVLFKNMLMEFNNSEMNIIITNILNNIVSKKMVKGNEKETSRGVSIADTATEITDILQPIKMKNEVVQMPPKKNTISKKTNKQKFSLGMAPNKSRQASQRQVSGWEPSILQKSKKILKDLRRSIIVVPIETNEEDTEQ